MTKIEEELEVAELVIDKIHNTTGWDEAHKDEKEDKAIPPETFQDAIMDLMTLGLLRRLL